MILGVVNELDAELFANRIFRIIKNSKLLFLAAQNSIRANQVFTTKNFNKCAPTLDKTHHFVKSVKKKTLKANLNSATSI